MSFKRDVVVLTLAFFTLVANGRAGASPAWTANPITLDNAKEGTLYTQSVAPFARDPEEGAILTFSKVSGPAWAGVTSAGGLSGTPARADVGLSAFVLRVTDQAGASADTTVKVAVDITHHPPQWTQDPIALPPASQGVAYSFDLSSLASTDEQVLLTFRKVNGPDWLEVSQDGKLSGTPAKSDVGPFSAVFLADNGWATARAGATGQVNPTVQPPVIGAIPPFSVNERQTLTQRINGYVTDPDGAGLTFSLGVTEDWITLSSDGVLTLTPHDKDIGAHTVPFSVSNGGKPVAGTLAITVLRDPRPPVWTESPVRFTAKSNKIFSADLSPFAKDLDGVPLTFSKKSGPAWLSVAKDGTLSGTPARAVPGQNLFKVSVKNDGLSADADLIVTVVDPFPAPFWTANPISLPDAQEKAPYSQSVTSYAVVTGEGDELVFRKISGPAWVTVGAEGTISGTPAYTDVGINSVVIEAINIVGKTSDVTAVMTVKKAAIPPQWAQNPVTLSQATEGLPFQFDLSSYASDSQGRPLTFRKSAGPRWLRAGFDGKLTGIPSQADLGNFVAKFVVSNGDASAEVVANGQVVNGVHPPQITPPVLTYELKERGTKTDDLNQYVTDPDGKALAFSLETQATWVTLATDGKLTLNPLHADLGEHAFRFQVSDGRASTEGVIKVKVQRDPQLPLWSTDPLELTAIVGQTFTFRLADRVSDPDGVPLTFILKSGPAWLTVSLNGVLSGTPQKGNLGDNSFVIAARNDRLSTEATVVVSVSDPHKGPYWTYNPIHLPHGRVGESYVQSVAPFAKSDQGDVLTFQKISGPDWASISSTGFLMGLPSKGDLGTSAIQIQVSDAHGKTAQTTVQVPIDPPPYVPPQWTKMPLALGRAVAGKAFQFELAPFAIDSEQNPLHFKLLKGPSWIVVSDAGRVTGTPAGADVGQFAATFEVTDGTTDVPDDAFGEVILPAGHPPQFIAGSLVFMVKEGEVENVNLADPRFVANPDGNPLKFTLDSLPDWMSLTGEGNLTLKPQHANIGSYTLALTVIDTVQGLSGSSPLIVSVTADPSLVTDSIAVDQKVPGAAAESLWVVDNSDSSGDLMGALQNHIGRYYDDLAAAELHHTGVFLSAAPDAFQGGPIMGESGSPLISWNDSDPAAKFRHRLDLSYVADADNSPVWSLQKFYEALPGMSDLYPKNYFVAGVPMDVLVVAGQPDDYPSYAEGTPEESETPADFASAFVKVHNLSKKPYRISSIASDETCGDRPGSRDENAYRALASATGGTYWNSDDDDFDMEQALHEYAQKAIFRAYIVAKRKIPLSKVPMSEKGIEVDLAGKVLPVEAWSYDSLSHSIALRWDLIDLSSLQPGDRIEIRYRKDDARG